MKEARQKKPVPTASPDIADPAAEVPAAQPYTIREFARLSPTEKDAVWLETAKRLAPYYRDDPELTIFTKELAADPVYDCDVREEP